MVAASVLIAGTGYGKRFDTDLADAVFDGFAGIVAITERWREDSTS